MWFSRASKTHTGRRAVLVGLSLYVVVPTGIGTDLEVFRPAIRTRRASTTRPRLPHPWAPLQGSTAAVSLQSLRFVVTLGDALTRVTGQHGRSSRPQRPRVLACQCARRVPEGTRRAVRRRSVEPIVSEPKPTDVRAEIRAAKPPAAEAEAYELATPRSRPQLAEAARGIEPSHLLDDLGEPKQPVEMTSGTALVACHLRVRERSAEVAITSRSEEPKAGVSVPTERARRATKLRDCLE